MEEPNRQEEFSITINGAEYRMSYTFNDICDGEEAAHDKWKQYHINFFNVYFTPGMIHTVKDLFAVSLERYHPQIPFAARRKLVDLGNFIIIFGVQFSVFGDAILEARKDTKSSDTLARFVFSTRRPLHY